MRKTNTWGGVTKRLERVPETNSLGLVVPPSPEELAYFAVKPQNAATDGIDRHHLYWPRALYKPNSLAYKFREHRFNSIWLLRSDHDGIHANYDGVPFPPRAVMHAFLGEAALLDNLNVNLSAVAMIDDAIYEGRVRLPKRVQQSRLQKLEAIHTSLEQIPNLQIIQGTNARVAVERAQILSKAGELLSVETPGLPLAA